MATWGVGARGRDPLSYKPKQFGMWLGGQMEDRERRQDNSQFETMLGTSGLTEDEKRMARLFRQSPQIAQAFARRDEAEANRQAMAERQNERLRASEEQLKARQDYSDQVAKAKAQAEKEEKEGAVSEAQTAGYKVFLPTRFKDMAPGAVEKQATLGPLKFKTGGYEATILPDKAMATIARLDPSNPALKGAMSQTQNFAMQGKIEGERFKVATEKRKADEKAAQAKAEKEALDQRRESARAWIGEGATEDEIRRYEFMSQAEGAKPELVAADIRNERERKAGAAEDAEEKRRLRLLDMASDYNAALEEIKNANALTPPTPATIRTFTSLREKLKAEGIEIPGGNAPVNIYQFSRGKKSESKQEKPAAPQVDKKEIRAAAEATAARINQEFKEAEARGDKAAMEKLEREIEELRDRWDADQAMRLEGFTEEIGEAVTQRNMLPKFKTGSMA